MLLVPGCINVIPNSPCHFSHKFLLIKDTPRAWRLPNVGILLVITTIYFKNRSTTLNCNRFQSSICHVNVSISENFLRFLYNYNQTSTWQIFNTSMTFPYISFEIIYVSGLIFFFTNFYSNFTFSSIIRLISDPYW